MNAETSPDKARYFTYMLRCGDGSLYTGYTDDLEKRLKKHASGEGAKYTRSHLPVELAYYEAFATKSEAMKREAAIKKLSKAKKEALISSTCL
ncbi:MAG: GIY-YIG nuclease family protein [Lachnospiraceae bacterium]|nr:GIY-YIG nuclease family protein [Lachnospiraceae bacterium]